MNNEAPPDQGSLLLAVDAPADPTRRTASADPHDSDGTEGDEGDGTDGSEEGDPDGSESDGSESDGADGSEGDQQDS